MTDYPLDHLLSDLSFVLTAVDSEDEVLEAVAPLAQKFAAGLRRPAVADFTWNEKHGTGDLELHRAADDGPCISLGAWRPGCEVPPHDHGTWSVMVAVEGTVRNTLWHRRDDGAQPAYAEIEAANSQAISPGEAHCMTAKEIHSVANIGDEISFTLHIVGRGLEATGRHQYDPEARSAHTIAHDLE